MSASGGLVKALHNASELDVNTIQIHASPPQRWNRSPFPIGVEADFLALRPKSKVKKLFFHGIYLINLATPDREQLDLSKNSLVHSLDLLHRVNGDGLIFHLGSLKGQSNEKKAFRQVASALNWVLERAKSDARLLLEVTAGGGDIIGDRIEELAEIYAMVEQQARVGFALDSQHLWASGYDLVGDIESVIHGIETTLNLNKVWAIHLNDSKTEKGSRRDRHENFGNGTIGRDALTRFFLHPKLLQIPFILETPAMKTLELAKTEVAKLKKLAS